MKALILSLSALFLLSFNGQQDRLITRDAYVRFFSSTPLEDIEGISKQASSVIDTKTGAIAFKIPMKSFRFEKALMQEHFNENYVESDKFPNATLSAVIVDWDAFYLSDKKELKTRVKGDITIHGVTQPLDVPVTLEKSGDKVLLNCSFDVKTAEFDIKIPSTVRKNIAETIEVTVKAKY